MAAMLDGMVDKVVQIVTNDGRNIVGMLKGFDQTTNVILDECHERVFSPEAGVEQARGAGGGGEGSGGGGGGEGGGGEGCGEGGGGERAVGRSAAGEVSGGAGGSGGIGARATGRPSRTRSRSKLLYSLRSQVQLGLYIVRGDNMCASAPRRHRPLHH